MCVLGSINAGKLLFTIVLGIEDLNCLHEPSVCHKSIDSKYLKKIDRISTKIQDTKKLNK